MSTPTSMYQEIGRGTQDYGRGLASSQTEATMLFTRESASAVLAELARAHRDGNDACGIEDAAASSLHVKGLDLEAAALVRTALEGGKGPVAVLLFLAAHSRAKSDDGIGIAATMLEGLVHRLLDADTPFDLEDECTRDTIIAQAAHLVPDCAGASLRNMYAITEATVFAMYEARGKEPSRDHVSWPIERAARCMVENFSGESEDGDLDEAATFVDALRGLASCTDEAPSARPTDRQLALLADTLEYGEPGPNSGCADEWPAAREAACAWLRSLVPESTVSQVEASIESH